MHFFLLGLWAAWLFTSSSKKQAFLTELSGISCIISFLCLDFCLFLEREREKVGTRNHKCTTKNTYEFSIWIRLEGFFFFNNYFIHNFFNNSIAGEIEICFNYDPLITISQVFEFIIIILNGVFYKEKL